MGNALSAALAQSLARSKRSSRIDLRITKNSGRGACTEPRPAGFTFPEARAVPIPDPALDQIWVKQHTLLSVSSCGQQDAF